MDTVIGRIVKKTEDLGIAGNTLILFNGDNGTNKVIESKLGERVMLRRIPRDRNVALGLHAVRYWRGHPSEVTLQNL